MREIKFRAWDKAYKQMVYTNFVGLAKLAVTFDGQVFSYTDWGEVDYDADKMTHTANYIDRFELMQFTGLLDKNGKEIYEGDILREDSSPKLKLLSHNKGLKKDRSCQAIVKFGLHDVPSSDPFCWAKAYGFYIDGEAIYSGLGQYKPTNEDSEFSIEVIGNIHEPLATP